MRETLRSNVRCRWVNLTPFHLRRGREDVPSSRGGGAEADRGGVAGGVAGGGGGGGVGGGGVSGGGGGDGGDGSGGASGRSVRRNRMATQAALLDVCAGHEGSPIAEVAGAILQGEAWADPMVQLREDFVACEDAYPHEVPLLLDAQKAGFAVEMIHLLRRIRTLMLTHGSPGASAGAPPPAPTTARAAADAFEPPHARARTETAAAAAAAPAAFRVTTFDDELRRVVSRPMPPPVAARRVVDSLTAFVACVAEVLARGTSEKLIVDVVGLATMPSTYTPASHQQCLGAWHVRWIGGGQTVSAFRAPVLQIWKKDTSQSIVDVPAHFGTGQTVALIVGASIKVLKAEWAFIDMSLSGGRTLVALEANAAPRPMAELSPAALARRGSSSATAAAAAAPLPRGATAAARPATAASPARPAWLGGSPDPVRSPPSFARASASATPPTPRALPPPPTTLVLDDEDDEDASKDADA